MTSAKVVETSVNVIKHPSEDYTQPDDRTLLNYDMTPGFKPFTILLVIGIFSLALEGLNITPLPAAESREKIFV